MAENMEKIMAIKRDSRGLVNMMFDELDALKAGKSTPQQARTKAAVVNTIISIKRLEMDYARFVSTERLSKDSNLKALPMSG